MATAAQKKFRDMIVDERIDFVAKFANLSEQSAGVLRDWKAAKSAEGENFLTYAKIPVGILPKITVNGMARMVPMITEEASVIAGIANGVKMAEKCGGFHASVKGNTTPAQVQVVGVPSSEIENAIENIKKAETMLVEVANKTSPKTVAAGGGLVSITPKRIDTRVGPQIIVDFEADCSSAMGAATVSKMAEAMAPEIERATGGKVVGRILSNLMPGRVVFVEATFDKELLALDKKVEHDGKEEVLKITGDEMVEAIVALSAWSEVDQFRATTHNKGIMNGIISAAAAVGQDTRALEAGAHSYAAFNRSYAPLSHFEKDANGNLHGWLEVPIPVGVLGGTIKSNDTVRVNLELTQCTDPKELAMLLGAVGLAQNLAALRMVAGEGITLGHSELEKERVESVRGSENLIRI